jgi:hypothetical protein
MTSGSNCLHLNGRETDDARSMAKHIRLLLQSCNTAGKTPAFDTEQVQKVLDKIDTSNEVVTHCKRQLVKRHRGPDRKPERSEPPAWSFSSLASAEVAMVTACTTWSRVSLGLIVIAMRVHFAYRACDHSWLNQIMRHHDTKCQRERKLLMRISHTGYLSSCVSSLTIAWRT